MTSMFNDGRAYFLRVGFGAETSGEIVRVHENKIFGNAYIDFYNDCVKFPNGHEGQFLRLETPERKDGSVVVAVNWRNEIAVVKQFRYAPRVWTIELPRGFCKPNEVGQFLTGWREFSEEVGGQLDFVNTWSLGRVLTDTGKLHDAPFIILAKSELNDIPDSYLAQHPDDEEVIIHKRGGNWVSYLQLREWIESGLVVDMFTCAAFARLRPHFDETGNFCPNQKLLDSEHISRGDRDFLY